MRYVLIGEYPPSTRCVYMYVALISLVVTSNKDVPISSLNRTQAIPCFSTYVCNFEKKNMGQETKSSLSGLTAYST